MCWQQADGVLNVDNLVDHIEGFEWKKEPLLVEFSADEKVHYVTGSHTHTHTYI